MAVVADKVVTILQADVNSHIANINKATASYVANVDRMEAETLAAAGAFDVAGTRANRAFQSINQNVPRVTQNMNALRGSTGNVAAQFQDIGVQLAGGTSPFLIMAQQVPQVVLATQSLGGVLAGLRLAVTSLLSPVGLATSAFVLAAGAAISYFSDADDESKKTNKELENHLKLIEGVAERWGDAVPSIKKYAEEIKKLKSELEVREATGITIDKIFEDARKTLAEDLTPELVDLIAKLQAAGANTGEIVKLQNAFKNYKDAIDAGNDSTKEHRDLVNTLSTLYINSQIPAANEFAKAVDGIAQSFINMGIEADRARREADRALNVEQIGEGGRESRFGSFLQLPDTAPVPGRLGVDDVGSNPALRGFTESIGDAQSAIEAFTERVIRAESGGDRNAKNPNSSATGTGQFIASTWLALFRKYYPEEAKNMGRDAILELRKDADRSYALIQAYARENAQVLQRAGIHVDEAALQLSHFLGVGDAAKVLKAAPGTPLDGLINAQSIAANPTILGGGRTVDDVIAYANRRASGLGTSQAREKTPDDIFAGNMAEIERRIDLINAEYEAQAKLNPLIKDYGFEVEKAKIKQELLNDAAKAGLTVDADLAAKIDTLAENYAKASVARDQLTESQKRAADAAREGSEFGKDVLGGFIRDLINGKSAADALADALLKIADRLLDVALNAAFGLGPGGNGTGGPLSWIGALFGGLFRARGGPVEKGMPYIVGDKYGMGQAEMFVPKQDGMIVPGVPKMGGRSNANSGGFIETRVISEVVNGNLVPTMIEVAGIVGGSQIKQVDKRFPSRVTSMQARGV